MTENAAGAALAEMIRRARLRVPYSKTELAQRAHLSRRTVHAHETGEHVPNTTALRAYARWLDVEFETMYRLSERARRERDEQA